MVLALDGATEYLALAVATEGTGLVASRTIQLGREHAARLPGELAGFLADNALAARDLSTIVVGSGPGSYTGIRVTVAFAKGLARALRVPLFGASSLLALGGPSLTPGAVGVALLDARRGNCYAQPIRRETDLPGRVPVVSALGDPTKVAREDLVTAFPGLAPLPETQPDAAFLCAVALPGGVAVGAVIPLYL